MEITDKVSVINPENHKHEYDGIIVGMSPISVRVQRCNTTDINQAELWPIEWVKPIQMTSIDPSKFWMIQAAELALRTQLRVSALKRVSNSVKQQVNNVASACLDTVKMIATVEDARACGCQQVAERLPSK